MKNIKRILAWIGIIILLSLYIVTFVISLIKPAVTSGLLMACIFTTITLPCLLYAFQLIYRVLKDSKPNDTLQQNKQNDIQRETTK